MAVDTTKLEYWTAHIKNWQTSGLAQRRYCERAGLKFATFDYWRRHTRSDSEGVVCSKKRLTGGLTLVPVRVADLQRNEPLILTSPAGWELRLPASVEAGWLMTVLRQLP